MRALALSDHRRNGVYIRPATATFAVASGRLVGCNFDDKVARDLMRTHVPRARQAEDGLTKFQRYRRQQLHRGMKQLRIWVPDPHGPSFAAEAKQQGMRLRGRPEEAETLDFIAAAAAWPEA